MANCNYKVKIKDIQNKYKFKIFCMGDKYDDTEIREEIEALEEELTDTKEEVERANLVYNALPKVEGTGESITLNDTANAPLKLSLKGNTYQDSTSGKNLCNFGTWTTTSIGLTIIRNGSELKISGTTTGAGFILNNSPVTTLPAGTYTLSTKRAGTITGNGESLTIKNKTTDTFILDTLFTAQNTYTFVLDQSSEIEINIYCRGADHIFTGVTILVQLEKGSNATSYEPYTNGASPNPDYPQEIEVVTGLNEVKVEGKNLCNTSIVANLTSGNEKWVTTRLGDVKWENGKTYYIKAFLEKQSNEVVQIINYDYKGIDNKLGVITFNGTVPGIRVGANSLNSNITNEEVKIMVSTETFTEYEAYKGQTYPINLGSIELCKIGTYQDRIYKNNGNWYLHKEIGKVVLNGSETYYYNSVINSMRYTAINDNLINEAIATVISNNFVGVSYNGRISITTPRIYFENNNLQIRSSGFTNINDFKTWLSTHNTTCYYVLATPTDTQITDTTLISQLNALEKALAYKNQTNISQTNADKPFIIDASTIYDLSNLVTRVAVLETE